MSSSELCSIKRSWSLGSIMSSACISNQSSPSSKEKTDLSLTGRAKPLSKLHLIPHLFKCCWSSSRYSSWATLDVGSITSRCLKYFGPEWATANRAYLGCFLVHKLIGWFEEVLGDNSRSRYWKREHFRLRKDTFLRFIALVAPENLKEKSYPYTKASGDRFVAAR